MVLIPFRIHASFSCRKPRIFQVSTLFSNGKNPWVRCSIKCLLHFYRSYMDDSNINLQTFFSTICLHINLFSISHVICLVCFCFLNYLMVHFWFMYTERLFLLLPIGYTYSFSPIIFIILFYLIGFIFVILLNCCINSMTSTTPMQCVGLLIWVIQFVA